MENIFYDSDPELRWQLLTLLDHALYLDHQELLFQVDLMMMKKLVVCSQLYGEADPDQDVSPDTEDPEAAGETLETVSHCWFSQMKTLFQVIFNWT